MRFGVILYSAKFIKKIEMGGGEIEFSAVENDKQNGDDISSLVFDFSFWIYLSYIFC